MIIVEPMEFAFTHPEGEILCFIIGDVDYAYLLSKLQKPQWTRIMISRGEGQSMLHTNGRKNMRWKTDVLQLPVNIKPTAKAAPLHTANGVRVVVRVREPLLLPLLSIR